MPVSKGFLSQVQPGIQAFTNFQPPPAPSFIPGVANTGGAPAPPVDMTGMPPAPAPAAPMGGMSVQPPPVTEANMSVQPPPPPAPPPPGPAPGPVMATVGGAPAHEVMKAGPTQIALLNERDRVLQRANEKQATLESKSALNQAMAASVARDEAQKKIDAEQSAMAEEQKRIEAAKLHLDQATAPLNKPIEDYWSDKSVGQKVGMALSVAIGAFGAAFGKTGVNPAMQVLQASMDQDLKTKQMNFQRGVAVKDAAQQDFNNLVRQIGMNPAKERYEAAMKERLAAQAMGAAASAKLPEIAANAEKVAAQLQADSLEKKATALMGYVQATKGQKQVIDPALGNVPIGLDKYGEYQVKKSLEGQKQEGELAIAEAKEGRSKVAEGVKFIAEKAQSANLPGTIASIDAAASELKKGNTKGIGRVGAAIRDTLGQGAYSAVFGQDASQREQDWAMLKQQIMTSLTGAGMGAEERATYDTMLEGAKSPEARIHSIQRAREAAVAKMNSIKAGAGPEAAAIFDANLKAVSPQAIPSTPVKK